MRKQLEGHRRMRQRSGLVLAVLLVIAIAPTVSSQSAVPSQVARSPLEDSVVAVLAHDPADGKFLKRATAFHVGDGVFYTNAHVVRTLLPSNFSEMYLAGRGSNRTPASWMGPIQSTCVNPRWQGQGTEIARPFDVARLTIAHAAKLPPALRLSEEMIEVGMHVTIAGFPAASHGWPPKLYKAIGRIEAINHMMQTFLIDVESGFALEGSSGSPVLTDAGHVIGIVYARAGIRDRSAASRIAAITTQVIQSSCP